MLFKEVIGQEKIKERLIHGVKENRVSHAQLFLGENGVGNLPLALAYAQYVNCHNPQETDSCGVCDSCRKMMSFEHPDMHYSFPVITRKSGTKPVSNDYLVEWRKALKENPYIDYMDWMEKIGAENKQGNITAEECREIIKKLSLKPMYGGYKILLMWLPEYLGAQGNILLKIMEEPPENTLFLLVANDEEKIISTILSRTQMLRIPRLENKAIQNALTEKLGLDEDEAGRIAQLAEGNYNKALKMVQVGESNYTEEFVQWMRYCFKPDLPGIIKWVDGMAATGRENQKNFLKYGINMIRECLLLNRELPELTRLLESEKSFVQSFSQFIGENNIYELIEAFDKAHFYIERNAHPKILFFNLSLLVNELLLRQRQKA